MLSSDFYFYKQKNKKKFEHRRLRIIDESYSLFGDKATLTFRGKQDTDVESTAEFARRPSLVRRPSTGILRPGSSRSRHVVIAPNVSILPPVDPSGPKLVSAETQDADTSDIHHTEKKLEFLKEVEEKQKPTTQGRKTDWNLSEAKFASSSILSRLSKYLYEISENFEVNLPVDLVDELSRNHEHLVENTVVVKRQWQTDCYQDFEVKNKRPFLTSVPEEPQLRQDVKAFVGKLVSKQKKVKEKHVQLKQKPTQSKKMSSPERPMTARSVMSNYSIKSDVSQPSDDGRESRNDYDLLPAELRPSILNYRRESSTPKLKTVRTSTATRLEKMRKLRGMDSVSPKTKKKKTKFQSEESASEKSVKEEKVEEDQSGTAQNKPVTTTIPFTLSTPLYEEWIVTPGDLQDPEANTLRLWEKQLKELMRSREEEKMLAKQKGEDGPLFVKFYNDPQMRTLRTKGHQRSATFPMPTIFSKLPPSVASFSTPSPNDALLIGEGLTVFVLTLPDGSGYCNYHSGRVAVSMSRRDSVGRGLYTLVYEDSEGSPLIAYFTPTSSGCCYHQNGSLRMLFNSEGGSLFDEDGHVTRKWAWPSNGLNLPVSVHIQINANLSLRCTSLSSITLRFSCRGQSHKFSVGSSDSNEQKTVPTEEKMQSDVVDLFTSKFALDRTPGSETDIVPIKITKKRNIRREPSSLSEDEEAQALVHEKPAKELSVYRERIKTVVEDWMHHYRESIGIALPNRLLSSSKKRPQTNLSSLSSRELLSQRGQRMVQSSMGYYPGGGPSRPLSRQGKHTRSYTHPFPSPSTSRAPSPFQQLGLPSLRAGASSIPVPESERSRSLSPPKSTSTMDNIKSTSSQQLKPFKTGISKPKPQLVTNYNGCPIGLRNKLLKNLNSTPPCKCNKRHIPSICDLEYDTFLLTQVPKSQLIIVCVVSSVMENSCPCEPMLNAVHSMLNRNRFSPCNQCSADPYRILKYDICQAVHMDGQQSNKPLLMERHNATPGTFLMYMGGCLVYADRTFNGYGTAKKDFLKQVHKSITDGVMGKCLPCDFKLSHRNGSKIQSRNAWAYPVSGVMQDLIPFTPESGSGSISRHSVVDVKDSILEGSVTDKSFAELSYARDYLQLSLNPSDFNSRSQSRVSLLEASVAGSVASVAGN